MLTAPLLQRRIAYRVCASGNLHYGWPWTRSRNASKTSRDRAPTRRNAALNEPSRHSAAVVQEEKNANLYEQLFGTSRSEAEQRVSEEEEIPRLPLEDGKVYTPRRPEIRRLPESSGSAYRKLLENGDRAQDQPQISVLVLRNASRHLTEDDFRRLVPQGSHLEGWTLEQGDIIQVIPGRDPATMEQSNFYYLLFSSQLSAFDYQGHATRVYRIVASHTPSSILSPIMPPPGVTARNMDANAAIQSFSLVAPNHPLDLRQLKPPLTPVMQAIVRNRGYPFFVARKDRMPYEARLTLDGPQVHESAIRHFFMKDGKQRGLSWSGDERANPVVTKWVHDERKHGHMSAMSRKRAATEWGMKHEDAEANREVQRQKTETTAHEIQQDHSVQHKSNDAFESMDANCEADGWVSKPRQAFIIGFATERAMQSFVHHWHRRRMETEGFEQDTRSDLPPIINVEALW
jgi:hypothetical protein